MKRSQISLLVIFLLTLAGLPRQWTFAAGLKSIFKENKESFDSRICPTCPRFFNDWTDLFPVPDLIVEWSEQVGPVQDSRVPVVVVVKNRGNSRVATQVVVRAYQVRHGSKVWLPLNAEGTVYVDDILVFDDLWPDEATSVYGLLYLPDARYRPQLVHIVVDPPVMDEFSAWYGRVLESNEQNNT